MEVSDPNMLLLRLGAMDKGGGVTGLVYVIGATNYTPL